MARGGRGFRQYWIDKHLNLDDGDVLRWMVVDRPERDPFIAFLRLDGVGGLHGSKGIALLEAAGRPDALARRNLLVVTREHIDWKGWGRFGSLARYRSYDQERNPEVPPSLSLKEGDPWPFDPEWKVCAGDVDFIRQGVPVYGRLHWLPEKRLEWERRVAETTARIRRLLGG